MRTDGRTRERTPLIQAYGSRHGAASTVLRTLSRVRALELAPRTGGAVTVNQLRGGGADGGAVGGNHALLSNLDFASAAHTGFVAADGSVVGATAQAQDFGANGITADAIAESTPAAGITVAHVVVLVGGFRSQNPGWMGGNVLYGSQIAAGSFRLRANDVDASPASITIDDVTAFVCSSGFTFNQGFTIVGGIGMSGNLVMTGFAIISTGAFISNAGLPFTATNTINAASNQVGIWYGNNSRIGLVGDEAFYGYHLCSDAGGLAVEFARVTWRIVDPAAASKDGAIDYAVMVANVLTTILTLEGSGIAVVGTVSASDDIVFTGATGNRRLRQASSYLQIDEDAAFVADVIIFSTNDILGVPRFIRDPANITRISFTAGGPTNVVGDFAITGRFVGELNLDRTNAFDQALSVGQFAGDNFVINPGDTTGFAGRYVFGFGLSGVLDTFLWRLGVGSLTWQMEGMRIQDGAIAAGHVPPGSVLLELNSVLRALLLPRMTTVQRDAMAAINGMMIYNITTAVVESYEGGAWVNT